MTGTGRHVAELGPVRHRATFAEVATPGRRGRGVGRAGAGPRPPGCTVKPIGAGHSFTGDRRHRRDLAAARPAVRAASRSTRTPGRVTLGAGTSLRDLPALLAPLRARAGEHGRHRPADRSPARSRPEPTAPAPISPASPRQVVGLRMVLADGSVVELLGARERRAVRRGPARPRCARRADRGDGAVRAGVPAGRRRAPGAARRGARRLRRADGRRRPLRVLLVPAHRHGADEDEPAAAAGRRTRRPVPRLRGWSTTSSSATACSRPTCALGRPRCRRGPDGESSSPPSLVSARGVHRPLAPGVHLAAPGAVPRDGVRDPACRAARTCCARSDADPAPRAGGSRSRWRSGSPRPTTSGCRPPTGATPPTSRCTATTASRSRRTSPQVEEIFGAVAGRPHWGKLHTLDAGRLGSLYPRLADAVRVRSRVDPAGLFDNPYLERVLGPATPRS